MWDAGFRGFAGIKLVLGMRRGGLQVPGLRALMTRGLTQSSNFIRAYRWRECNRSDAFVKPQRNDTVLLSVFPQFSWLLWLLCSSQAPALSAILPLLTGCLSCIADIRPMSTVVHGHI